MTGKHLRGYGPRSETPQTEPIPGRESVMVENEAGGYVFKADRWQRLRRFLILGSEGGTYYASERKTTKLGIDSLRACLAEDGPRAVAEIVVVSQEGLAPRNDYAIYALAVAASDKDPATRALALEALPLVCRTATHLFMFCGFVEQWRGWGRALRRAVAAWYESKSPDRLAYQLVKYRNREGWTHRDVLRLAHPVGASLAHKQLYTFATTGEIPSRGEFDAGLEGERLIEGFLQLQASATPKQSARIIAEYGLPREAVPTEFLKNAEVWDALLRGGNGMPITALIRNLANMTRCGLIAPFSDAAAIVSQRLLDKETLVRGRVHPVQILIAAMTYEMGTGLRSRNTVDYTPVPQVLDALEQAFYLAFAAVEPTGKRTLIGVDWSGSMAGSYLGYGLGGGVLGIPGLTPNVLASAMALVTVNTEANYMVLGFADEPRPVSFRPGMSLAEAIEITRNRSGSGTDCALPMLWAHRNGVDADAIVIYTDNQTWAGRHGHPAQALRAYREAVGHDVKLVACAMTATEFSIADPLDTSSLDIVGFSADTPQVIANFSAGRI